MTRPKQLSLKRAIRTKMRFLKPATVAVAAAILAVFSSCSSPTPKGPMVVRTLQQEEAGSAFGGEVVVNSVTTNATVLSVDTAQRRLLLRFPGGIEATYRAGNGISNFDQIRVGDQVKTTVVEEFAVSIAAPDALSYATNRVSVIRAPNGLELGPKPVDTVRLTAKILAFNYYLNQVTLQLGDGTTRTVRVRETVNLGNYNVGDIVSVLITEAMTISLEKQ
jgi:hypothetical protein